MLVELPITPVVEPLPDRAREFIAEGLRRGKRIDCFDWVPSNHEVVYAVLRAMPPARFCEWGSGIGIVTGLAEMLGFTARGIELDTAMAAASRQLLADFGLSARIETGSYYELYCEADLYFAYCWPGQMMALEEHFERATPDAARLLICHGAEDVRCKRKSP